MTALCPDYPEPSPAPYPCKDCKECGSFCRKLLDGNRPSHADLVDKVRAAVNLSGSISIKTVTTVRIVTHDR